MNKKLLKLHIENGYDPERHSVQDSLRSHNECCKNNDNEIEKGC